MIVVSGASGELGSAVVEHLLRQVSPAEVAVSVREPQGVQALAARGVAVRLGDYDRPDTLEKAFAGATRLLLVSSSGIDYETRVARHKNAIDAARRVKVGHVFYTSLVPAEGSVAYVMKAHVETERMLRDSALPFTVLKNGVYAEASEIYLGNYSRGEVEVPADGPVAWVSKADLAEGTAKLLTTGGHVGASRRLTGPTALTLTEYAACLAHATGRPLAVRIVPLDEYVAHQVEAGRPAENARQWASTYAAMARGEFAAVDPFLHTLLGRPLRTVESVLNVSASGTPSVA